MSTNLPAPRLPVATGVFCMALTVWGLNIPPAGRIVAAPPRLYDGRTLDEWRTSIQQIDFKSSERAAFVTGLRAIMNDPDAPWFTRRQAALTLGRIGEPAAPAIADLIRLLKAPVEPVETTPPLWALKSLALFGPLAVDAAPPAIAILTNPRQPMLLRLTATETLARIGVASGAGIESLIDGTRPVPSPDPDQLELRIACIEALQLARPPAAVPRLVDACEDPADRIRHAAAATLGFLGSNAEPAAEALGALVLFDEVPVVRETAARSLPLVGKRGAEVLNQLLQHASLDVQLQAIDAASRATANQTDFIPTLRSLFDHQSPAVRVHAMNAWWRLTRQAGPLLAPLVEFLRHDDRDVRKTASDTLLLIGPAARPAIPKLQRIATEGASDEQTAARRVLRALEPSPDL